MPKKLVSLSCGCKSFEPNIVVLKSVDLSVDAGEVLCIIGPSGVGKSTLLRCLTLLDRFDSGTLLYDDIVVCKNDENSGEFAYSNKDTIKKARSKFGLVFQGLNLFPHYTVRKNIIEPLMLSKGIDQISAEELVSDTIEILGLSDKLDNVPCDLSGGQQQRVAIARALAQSPEVLYFDEPTSALDPRLSRDVAQLIRKIASGGIATIIVTHDMGFAKDVADRIAIMSDGRFVEVGEKNQIFDNPTHEITKGFLKQDFLDLK